MAWAPAYVTTAELRSYLNISDDADDAELDLAIEAASRAVDVDTSRQFGVVSSPVERFFTARWDRRRCRWVVPIDDIMTTSGLVITAYDADGTSTGVITAYTLEPRNAAADGRPWELLVVKSTSTVQPTDVEAGVGGSGTWGWTAFPTTVKQATRLQSSRFFARRTSPYGIAGSPELGSEQRLLARVDPDVSVMLRSYRRWWAAA